MKFAKMPEEPPPPPEPTPTSKKGGLSSDESSGEESDTEDSDGEEGTSSGGEDSDSEAKRAHQLSYLQKQARILGCKIVKYDSQLLQDDREKEREGGGRDRESREGEKKEGSAQRTSIHFDHSPFFHLFR